MISAIFLSSKRGSRTSSISTMAPYGILVLKRSRSDLAIARPRANGREDMRGITYGGKERSQKHEQDYLELRHLGVGVESLDEQLKGDILQFLLLVMVG